MIPAHVGESVQPGERPAPHAERLARAKALTLAEREPDALVIAADTIGRMAIAFAKIPVGSVTSVLGGPSPSWVLLRGDTAKGMG